MMNLEKIMAQAQVFASAWALVGSRFDFCGGLENAEQEKAELERMVAELVEQRDTLCKKVKALESEALDDHWPHGATVKLRWAGTGYCEKHGWAKRDAEGNLISVCSGIRLDDSSWEVVQERKEQPPKGEERTQP